jgi:hypothetical protein
VPKRGGDVPTEFDSAAASAEMPGPAKEDEAAPARGVRLPC